MSENEIEKVTDLISKYLAGSAYQKLLLSREFDPKNPYDIEKFRGVVCRIRTKLRESFNKTDSSNIKEVLNLCRDIENLKRSETQDTTKIKYKSEYLIDLVDRITSEEGGRGILSYTNDLLDEITKAKREGRYKGMVLGLIVALGSLFLFNFIDFSTQGMFLTRPQGSALYIFFSIVVLIYLFYFLFKK